MKKDIEIPQVKDVHIVAIREWNDDFMENSWYAYLLNDTDKKLDLAMVVSDAYGTINGEERKTATFRHAFKEVAPKTAVKIELLENNVLQLNNEFRLSYFINEKLFDKKFIFEANSITENALIDLPAIPRTGIFAQ
ncbi:MAG TPA: hypothetical protein VKY32_09225 [Flavobacterium sp.]|nr:hypothetical protein [Flavobacterium sp.]